jgi:hypothetical protein
MAGSGASLLYSTYLGGGDLDSVSGLVVVETGEVHVAGTTSSVDFPVVDAAQPALGGGLCGDPSAPQPCADAFLARFDPAGSAIFATFFGGSGDDQAFGVGVHVEGPNAPTYATGLTRSPDLPTVKPLQPAFGGGSEDAFVVKLGEIETVPVAIDIKPNEFPNTINLGSGGTVAVAILSSPDFQAVTVDPSSVTLASAPVRLRGQGTLMVSQEDVNADGLVDLLVHVSTEALQLSEGDVNAVLNGMTFDGTPIAGADTIRVVP